MLEYEWGNPSTIMLTGNEDGGAAPPSDQAHRQIFDHYASHTLLPDHFLHGPGPTTTTTTNTTNTNNHNTIDISHHHFSPQAHHHVHHTFFDPRAFHGASSTHYPPPQPQPPPPPSMLSLDTFPHHAHCGPGPGPGLLLVPKSEDVGRPMDFVGSRIGLNLGGRTYFSSSEDDFVRLYRRSRPTEAGSTASSNSPRCQAEGCNADLSQAKHYHRRHKVCEFHSKASTVIAAGFTQRFCQQCSRFHLLSEFDNGKRSCRKRLADHNRRRRKTQQPTQEIHKSQPTNLDNAARSPPDSGAQLSSSVTVAVSPPDYFRQRPYQSASSSTTSSSLFFSSG